MSTDPMFAPFLDTVLGSASAPLRLRFEPAPSTSELAAFHAALPLPLTGSFAALLVSTNGLDLFGTRIFGVTPPEGTDGEAVADLVSRRMVPFHDWGNGDFDCLDLTKVVDAEPPVVFWNEEHANIFPIAHSFAKWVPMAVHEVSRFGRLLHPRDYELAEFVDAQGLYESIANVKKTFFGGPEIPDRPEDPRPPRRTGVRSWIKARLGRR